PHRHTHEPAVSAGLAAPGSLAVLSQRVTLPTNARIGAPPPEMVPMKDDLHDPGKTGIAHRDLHLSNARSTAARLAARRGDRLAGGGMAIMQSTSGPNSEALSGT